MTVPHRSAPTDALRLLSRRDLTVAECRARLLDRDHAPDDVEAAIAHLLETRALDDERVARTHARAAAHVKGRGRLRVQRELHARGIDRRVAAEALGEVFGELDERSMAARALQKKLRGRARLQDGEFARLYQHLIRQGFSADAARGALGALRRSRIPDRE